MENGKRLAKLAKDAGVKHYIWSSLPNAEKVSGGKYKVPHFTSKALVGPGLIALSICFVALDPRARNKGEKASLLPGE